MTTPTEAAPLHTSPYAPPRAQVADIEPGGPPMARPPQVTRAVKCLWAVFAIGVVFTVWTLAKPSAQYLRTVGPASQSNYWLVSLGVYTLIFLLSIWLYRAIGRGRNWARILFLILSGLSLLSLPLIFFSVKAGTQSLIEGLVSIVNLGISFYACYLLLTAPAREWFHAMKGR